MTNNPEKYFTPKRILSVIFFGFIILLVFVLYKYLDKNYAKYEYNTKVDYVVSIEGGKRISVEIKDGRIKFPIASVNPNSSYFLKIKGKSNLLGKIFVPRVQIKSSEYENWTFFELGFEGIRFLNFTHCINKNNLDFELNAKHFSIKDQMAELIVCPNNLINRSSPLLILSPHPDDAELAVFGTYSTNPTTFIMTVTSGEYGKLLFESITKDTLLNSILKGKLRTWNSITVPSLGGVPYENTLNLGFFDGTLKELFNNKTKKIRSKALPTSFTDRYRDYNFSSLKDSLSNQSTWENLVSNIEIVLKTSNRKR